jgi:hypothetical protein
MANSKVLSPDVHVPLAPVPESYDELLRRTDQQKALASEMIETARDMIDRAVAMRGHAWLCA